MSTPTFTVSNTITAIAATARAISKTTIGKFFARFALSGLESALFGVSHLSTGCLQKREISVMVLTPERLSTN